jgi:hypothetical protein
VFILDLGAAMVRWLLWILVKHGFVMFGDCWLRVVMQKGEAGMVARLWWWLWKWRAAVVACTEEEEPRV